jgi:hypothetical protein
VADRQERPGAAEPAGLEELTAALPDLEAARRKEADPRLAALAADLAARGLPPGLVQASAQVEPHPDPLADLRLRGELRQEVRAHLAVTCPGLSLRPGLLAALSDLQLEGQPGPLVRGLPSGL